MKMHKIDQITTTGKTKIDWLKEVPYKVSCFVWRAKMDRFPSAMALQRRWVWLESMTCKYCNHEEECSDHILVQCPSARLVMEWVFQWCGIHIDPFNTIVALCGGIDQRKYGFYKSFAMEPFEAYGGQKMINSATDEFHILCWQT
uniref:Reverse transcriptase zinc-binding domain-containing protein n=1 Tax=Lactuca sativa TaxID=4236 RepID=A0A9R1UTZ3_LACSA|nr:hypothetical protein LSAT_V11C800399230 [Lactuca sativa]